MHDDFPNRLTSDSPRSKEETEAQVPEREPSSQGPDDDPESTRIATECGGRPEVERNGHLLGDVHSVKVEEEDLRLLGEENEFVADL